MKYQIWRGYLGKWMVLTPDGHAYREESFKDAIQRMDIHELSRENV